MLSVFLLLISIPNNAQAIDYNSNNIYEHNDVSFESDIIIEESFTESEDNIVTFYLLNNCKARTIKQDIIARIQDIEHPTFDIIIPPPDN